MQRIFIWLIIFIPISTLSSQDRISPFVPLSKNITINRYGSNSQVSNQIQELNVNGNNTRDIIGSTVVVANVVDKYDGTVDIILDINIQSSDTSYVDAVSYSFPDNIVINSGSDINEAMPDSTSSALDAAIILDYVVGLVGDLPHTPGSSDSDAMFAIEGGTTEPGLTFEVPIKLTDGSNVRSFELEFDYDTEALSVDRVVWDTEVLSGLQIVDNQQEGVVKVSAAGMGSLPSGSLTLGYIKFSMNEFFNGYETNVTISRARANESDAIFDASVGVYTNSMLVISDWGDGGIPMEFALKQNYPNPFNPSTLIRYQLPEETNVTVSIYDLMGRKVRTLVYGEHQLAGYRQVMWNATNDLGQSVSAGMYIYMIQAGEFRQTKKMVLLK